MLITTCTLCSVGYKKNYILQYCCKSAAVVQVTSVHYTHSKLLPNNAYNSCLLVIKSIGITIGITIRAEKMRNKEDKCRKV